MRREANSKLLLASAGLCLGAAIVLTHPAPAVGQGARAEIVQPPAWVEHEADSGALRAGTTLPATTSISTGASGAVALLLSRSAQLGLGPDARLHLQREADPGARPQIDFRLAQGSVRLLFDDPGRDNPTWVVDAGRLRLEGTVADLWIRRTEERVAVCLMDGRVTITHPRIGDFSLEQPLGCFESPNDGLPTPVLPIDREDAIRRVTDAAPQPGLGRMRVGGGWVIQLISVTDADKATRLVQRLRESGYPAQTDRSTTSGKRVYRLRLNGFESREDAERIAAQLTGRFGIGRPSVSCPKSPPCQR